MTTSLAGCRSMPSFRSTNGSACRTRSNAPTCPRPTPRARALADRLRSGGEGHSREAYIGPALHDRLRDSLRADRRPVRRDDGARGFCGGPAARVSRHADGSHQFPCAAQQPAARLSHAGHRATVERGVASAGRGQDGVRASSAITSPRPRTRLDQASQTLDETGVRSRAIARQLRDVEIASRRSMRAALLVHALAASTDEVALATPSSASAGMFSALRRWRQQRVLRAQAIPDDLWRDGARVAAVPRDVYRRRARAPAREGRAVPRCQEHRRCARPRGHAAPARW